MKYLNLNIIAIATILFLSHNTFCMQRNNENISSSQAHKMSLDHILSPDQSQKMSLDHILSSENQEQTVPLTPQPSTSKSQYQQRLEYANILENRNRALAHENDRLRKELQRDSLETTYQQKLKYANILETNNRALAHENDKLRKELQFHSLASALQTGMDNIDAQLSALQKKAEANIKAEETRLLEKRFALGLSNRKLEQEKRRHIQSTPRNGVKRRKISHIK